MGAGLAKAAYAVTSALEVREHAPVRAYVYMALTAVDSDPSPTYFGGRSALASSMAVPSSESGFRAVERAMRALAKRGLVSIAKKGAPGRNTRYLLLDGAGHALTAFTPRSAAGDSEIHHGERGVNSSEHPTLSGRTPHAERPEHPTLSVDLRRKEEKEEETRASAPPPRSCRRHPSWEHSEPCRACANDRRAAEAQSATRAPATMSEQRSNCGPGNHRRLPDGSCILCIDRDPLADIA